MRTIESVVTVPTGIVPAPRCGECGRFFRAERAVCVERWITSPTPEPMGGDLYCNECKPLPAAPESARCPATILHNGGVSGTQCAGEAGHSGEHFNGNATWPAAPESEETP